MTFAQITDRFTKAIEQLGSDRMAVRLGAVYALERIAKDSNRDFSVIMETLAAFVRERVPKPSLENDETDEESAAAAGFDDRTDDVRKPPVDVAAAVVVLTRSIPKTSVLRTGRQVQRVDLRDVDLRGLDLPRADMSGFRFDRALMDGETSYAPNL